MNVNNYYTRGNGAARLSSYRVANVERGSPALRTVVARAREVFLGHGLTTRPASWSINPAIPPWFGVWPAAFVL